MYNKIGFALLCLLAGVVMLAVLYGMVANVAHG